MEPEKTLESREQYLIMFQAKLMKKVPFLDTFPQNLNYKDKDKNDTSMNLTQEKSKCMVGRESFFPFFWSFLTLFAKAVERVTWVVILGDEWGLNSSAFPPFPLS